ncbi:predicted protein [Naegleria gruberi]|uniref:Predicted protein n=1 Tax=Naegleria gruberi TaxID=5762 RepID=D2V5K8_NAEGR|nr:uncharacterized protein NAEGRDRAFT_64117 [Naegleria gruberi]EFC47816.1 predicted protein [Naegleria gruberi]|eukprot:XP_002680560.1 predicted protein [Naegleria gruberi strain NEG-M]
MRKRNRQDLENHQFINSEEIFINNIMEEKSKSVKLQQEIFSDDVCFEIISMLDDSWFILNNCSLISKQFFNVIKERSKLGIQFKKKFTEKRVELFMKSQFLNSIVKVKVYRWLLASLVKTNQTKFISEMKQLTSLNITNNQICVEGVKYISEMKQLLSLNISENEIGDKGAKYISEMKQLTSLNIYDNEISNEGVKYLSEMKQLTSLNIGVNRISDEEAKYISEMKQLISLNIGYNEIGDKGVKYISEMKQLTSLDIGDNPNW